MVHCPLAPLMASQHAGRQPLYDPLPTTYSPLATTYHPLPTTYYFRLHITYYLLRTMTYFYIYDLRLSCVFLLQPAVEPCNARGGSGGCVFVFVLGGYFAVTN